MLKADLKRSVPARMARITELKEGTKSAPAAAPVNSNPLGF